VIASALTTTFKPPFCWYQEMLVHADPYQTRFQALALEAVIEILSKAGADVIASKLADRYLNFESVHAELTRIFRGETG
jgi:hypothetical protein